MNKCSNAYGSLLSNILVGSPLPTLCNARLIQIASASHGGEVADALRRVVANRSSILVIASPSRSNRLLNSAQSPLAQDRHHAARRRVARSASPFCPGNVSYSSDKSSSMVAARMIRRSKKASIRSSPIGSAITRSAFIFILFPARQMSAAWHRVEKKQPTSVTSIRGGGSTKIDVIIQLNQRSGCHKSLRT